MYRLEESLRRSDEYQHLYRTALGKQGEAVETIIQLRVLAEHGYEGSRDNLIKYQQLASKWRHDDEVRASIVYLRLNLMHEPLVRVGDKMRDVDSLIVVGANDDNLTTRSLSSLMENNTKWLLVVTGSGT